MNSEQELHPSYGKISVSRFSGDSRFFASDVKHNGGVSLTISEASLERNIAHDWIHEKTHIIEVHMSALQFAELITVAMNTTGVPCTIYARDRKKIDPVPPSDTITLHEEEYNACAKEAADETRTAMRVIDAMLDGGRVSKTELRKARSHLHTAHQHISANLKYYADCFNKHITRSVCDAKASIESFVENKIRVLGIKSLGDVENRKEIDNECNRHSPR